MVAIGLPALTSCSSETRLSPGVYTSPLVRLQQLVGANNHLHTDEVRYRPSDGKLFHCGYDFGVIDARDPEHMVYLAQRLKHAIPGDKRTPGCIHLAWDGDVVYTVHRGNVDNPAFLSGWDLRPDPIDAQKLAPVQLPVLQEPGVSYEGIDAANGYIYVAQRQKGLAIYQRMAGNRIVRVGGASGLQNAWGVRVRGTTAFVSDGMAGMAIVNVAEPANPVVVAHVETGGQARGLALADNVAYVASGSAGLVVVDISTLTRPRVIGRVAMPGSAIRVDHSGQYVYVAAWNDARAYDVSAPATPKFVGAVRMTRALGSADDGRAPVTSRTLGVAAHGDTMFAGNWHVIHSFRLRPDLTAPSLLLPEEINLVDFGPVAPGVSVSVPLKVTNQGTAPLTLFDISTSDPRFVVTPNQMRVAAGEAATLSVTYTASGGQKETGLLHISSDDPDNPTRTGYLVGNQPGLGVGKAMPDTTLALLDGGQWSLSEAKGRVTLLAYFATF